jgi:hypothetical protein
MDLHKVRETFRTLSGRYDLADDDETDVLRELINSASRHLDRLTQHQKSPASHFEQLAADAFHADIPLCRGIKEVWVSSTTARWQIEKMDLQDLIYDYLSGDDISSGTPEFYSPVITRKIPSDADLSSFSSYMTYLDTLPNLGLDYNGIVIVPPTESIILVEVRGLFYSPELTDDEDENFWSRVHPMTLIKATLREIEIFNQNASKKRQWDDAIAEDIVSISKDLVEEDIAEITQIEN